VKLSKIEKVLLLVVTILAITIAILCAKLSTPPSSCKGDARCFEGIVTEVIDGDTLEIDSIRIRFALVDTPEYNQAGYSEAKDFISSMCPVGSAVIVDEDDNQAEGSGGRIVAAVYCNGKNLNEELVVRHLGIIDERFCGVSEFASEQWTGC